MKLNQDSIFYQARIRRSVVDPYILDRNMIALDQLGIPKNELIKMECLTNYLPNPKIVSNYILYLEDLMLAKQVCTICPVSKLKNLSIIEVPKFSEINRNMKNRRKNLKRYLIDSKYYQARFSPYYFSRLCKSIWNEDFSSMKWVAKDRMSLKKITLIENQVDFIPQFDESAKLIEAYGDLELKQTICKNCLIKDCEDKLGGNV